MNQQTLPDHIHRPHLRPIQPIPMLKDGEKFVALRDPAMLNPQTIVLPAGAMQVLYLFQGQRTLDEIAKQLNADVSQFVSLVQKLDELGLLWGPTFEELEKKQRDEIERRGSFPVRSSQALGRDAAACRTKIEDYFSEAEDPELDAVPIGIVAPHLDYDRGWPNYAAAYHPLRESEAPDRVVILGTNHMGIGDGVVLTQFGFETPLGICPSDAAIVQAIVEQLGRPVIVDQLDHMSEHSIELHLPWLQYCFGNVPLVAALIPDPLTPMIEDDGQRVDAGQFVDALREALSSAGGRTLFIASSDLSHVGPQFGEPVPVNEQRRIDVEQHDRDMIGKFLDGDADVFLDAMKWNNNPTRWCSIGNMAAILQLVQPEEVELLDYRQAVDEKGVAMVTSAAMALIGTRNELDRD